MTKVYLCNEVLFIGNWWWLLLGALLLLSALCGLFGLSPFTGKGLWLRWLAFCSGNGMDISTCGVRKCMGGVALSADRFPVLSPLSDRGAEDIASPGEQLDINEVELFGPGLSKSMPCLKRVHEYYEMTQVSKLHCPRVDKTQNDSLDNIFHSLTYWKNVAWDISWWKLDNDKGGMTSPCRVVPHARFENELSWRSDVESLCCKWDSEKAVSSSASWNALPNDPSEKISSDRLGTRRVWPPCAAFYVAACSLRWRISCCKHRTRTFFYATSLRRLPRHFLSHRCPLHFLPCLGSPNIGLDARIMPLYLLFRNYHSDRT